MRIPLFSILVPVYNAEKFLHTSVKSVLAQTYTDWELILVNDGSTDASGKICDELGAKRPEKIRVIHQENQGQAPARQTALSHARGQYVVFLDADDRLVPTALQTLFRTFQTYNCDCVIYGVQNEQNGKLYQHFTQDNFQLITDNRMLQRKILTNQQYNSLCRKALKRELFFPLEKLPISVHHGEDLLQTLSVLPRINTCVFIPDILYTYVQNSTSVIHTPDPRYITDFIQLSAHILTYLKEQNLFSGDDYQHFHNYSVWLLVERLKYIVRLPLAWGEKVKLFENLKNSDFYRTFLNNPTYHQPSGVLYTEFRLGLYRLLAWEVEAYTAFKRFLQTKFYYLKR